MVEKLLHIVVTLVVASVALQIICAVIQPYIHFLGLTITIALILLVVVAALIAIRWLLKNGIGSGGGGRFHS